MIERVDNAEPAMLARYDDIIDVRSPAEFAEDRIPGALNLPVLDDAERAEVGTIYAQESRFHARRVGAAYVARNVAKHLEGALAGKPANYRPLLYCWRGGQRSGAMATILSQIGWRVGVIDGGYKTWRRAVIAALQGSTAPLNVVLLDGQTGTAKSKILSRLAAIGVQTLDLEAMAAHRGSVFGALAAAQPGQKLFESELFAALGRLDLSRAIVVEAESNRIGRLALPARLWRAMLAAPHLEIAAPPAARAAFLVTTYAELLGDREKVVAAIDKLAPFNAKETLERWREEARAGAFETLAAGLIEAHYDPLYDRARKRRAAAPLAALRLARLDEAAIEDAAEAIRSLVERACFDRPRAGGDPALTVS